MGGEHGLCSRVPRGPSAVAASATSAGRRSGSTTPGWGLVHVPDDRRHHPLRVDVAGVQLHLPGLGHGLRFQTPPRSSSRWASRSAAPLLFVAVTERGLPWYAGLYGRWCLSARAGHIDMSTHLKQYTAEALADVGALGRVAGDRATGRIPALGVVSPAAIAASFLSSIGAVIAGSALAACILPALLARPRLVREPWTRPVPRGGRAAVDGAGRSAERPGQAGDYWRG